MTVDETGDDGVSTGIHPLHIALEEARDLRSRVGLRPSPDHLAVAGDQGGVGHGTERVTLPGTASVRIIRHEQADAVQEERAHDRPGRAP